MTKIERFAELLKKGEARHVSEWGRILNVTVPAVYGMVKSLAKNHGVNAQKSKGIISLSGSGEAQPMGLANPADDFRPIMQARLRALKRLSERDVNPAVFIAALDKAIIQILTD